MIGSAHTRTRPADAAIEGLGLAPVAKAAAYELKRRHPDVIFTSGRRDIASQARAMAGSLVRNRKWIAEAYPFSQASIACRKWLEDHPEATTWVQIQNGLESVLDRLPGKEALRLSKHLSGEAFDVRPVTDEARAEAIKGSIRSLPGLRRFVETEGGVPVWHVQF